MAQCVARAPGRPDARAARRSHRRARARLQHGVPPRRAARDRRLQPDLPARRRRRGRVLAAAGARLADRLRAGGARLASPPRVGRAPTGASRSATARARPGSMAHHPEKFLDGQHAVARPHLQPAAVRALAACGTRVNAGVWGTAAFPVGLPHRRRIRSRSCRTRRRGCWLSLALVVAGRARRC